MPPVSGLALRARLLSVFPLVLVARPANRKRTDIACNEKLSINSRTDFIAADLAHLTAQMFCRFRLKQQKHETFQQTDQISYNARRLNRKQIRSSKYMQLTWIRVHKWSKIIQEHLFFNELWQKFGANHWISVSFHWMQVRSLRRAYNLRQIYSKMAWRRSCSSNPSTSTKISTATCVKSFRIYFELDLWIQIRFLFKSPEWQPDLPPNTKDIFKDNSVWEVVNLTQFGSGTLKLKLLKVVKRST